MDEVKTSIAKTTEEAKEIAGEAFSITLKDGRDYAIPGFGYKDDALTVECVGEALEGNPVLLEAVANILGGSSEGNPIKAIIKSLPSILLKAPTLQTQLICIITKQEEQWVYDNLDFGEVLRFVPFFLGERPFIAVLSEMVSDMWESLSKKAEDLL